MSLSDRQSERSKTQRKPGILELDPSDAVLAQNKLLTNKGQEQFDRFRALEKRKILSERIFDIFEHGDYERFARIVQLRGWEKIVHPPTTYNPVIVREFYANALPEGDEPFSYTTMVRPTFIGGGMAPDADAGEEAGMDDDDEEDDGGEGDASMEEEDEEEAGSDDD
ncbi:unnamed protein product [Trifolium pratense]|uniref:Uncharacterized protein n=1 Tax=Trifolium pratense TaxID=57577 RepID=A0ACB0JS94_TRIPR|nr:unnamed protein product [Trifolium pratense]